MNPIPAPLGAPARPRIAGHPVDLAEVCRVADARAADGERLRRLHPEVVSALRDAGLFRLWVPVDYAGPGASVQEVVDIIETVSAADASAGWAIMIANTTALTAPLLSPEWARTIFAPADSCTGGYGMPAARAVPVDGGLRVTGRWSWGSGTDHCTWIGGGVRVVDADGNPTRAADGATTPFCFFDPADVELLDTWHVAGLRATASTDYAVSGAFVPEGRWAQLVGGTPRVDSPLVRFSFFGALAAGVAAVSLGLARRAVGELVALAEKRPMGSSRTLAERSAVQADLARAVAAHAQARAHLGDVIGRSWERATAGDPLGDELRVELRLAATGAVERATHAVDLCYHAGGGSSIHETNPLQRVFRDAHVATQHGMIAVRTLEPVGRFAFGLPTSTEQL
ncbi:MAG: hypothetical protein D6683_06480 [Actinomyces sp.]|nr:MAG: hypothetical protein D6683_06480 [Actinomyces sp.]